MDEKDIQQNIEIFRNTIEFLSMEDKVTIVNEIQNSVENWGQTLIDELNRLREFNN